MKNRYFAFWAIFLCFSCTQTEQKSENNETFWMSASEYNVKQAERLIEKIFPFIALIEGDHGEGKPYYDNAARWTVWYGTTVKPDGSRVKKNDPWIPKSKGREYCYYHLRTHVFPFFQYFERKLSDEQIIGTALFLYNVGGEAVTGYDLEGNKTKQGPSAFFDAVNSGQKTEECVKYLTGFRRCGGRRANGLLKRHWIEGAALLGILNADNIMGLMPTHFYVTKNFGNYYWLDKRRNMIKKGDYYILRYDRTTINTFFEMNTAKKGQKSVSSII